MMTPIRIGLGLVVVILIVTGIALAIYESDALIVWVFGVFSGWFTGWLTRGAIDES